MFRRFLIPSILALSSWAVAAPVPIAGRAPVPVDRLRVENPAVFPMTGVWRFKLDHGVSPAVEGKLPPNAPIPDFAALAASDADWKDIPVPANWEVEGFSIPTYQERTGNQSEDIGLYRRWVEVPATFAGQRVLWHFDGVYDGAEVFVNGVRAGYHESGFTAFDIDVTDALKPGKRNLMAVRVYKKTSSGSLDKGDFWCLGGIYRENYLVALPPLRVDDVTVVTDLDAEYRNATLKSTVRVAGKAGARFSLTGELYSLDGAKASLPAMNQAGVVGADGFATVVLTAPVVAPKLWSAEKPNLYYVFYTLSNALRAVERVEDRIGFRKVELKAGVMMVNGVPVKLTGANRHEEFLTLGHALTESVWKTDIALLKGANINAVRTSHYNHAARFLELCDEAGIYVLDESPFCWVAPELKDLTRQWAFLQRARETLARDKNRPSVVVWSCGNESGYGPNAQAVFDFMKANDPTRLALISQQGLGPNPKTDFDDYHYPPIPQIVAMIDSPARAKVPAIFTEIGGIEDPWGKVLADNWAPIWSSDGIAGAFIWEWQEQNLADRFPERWSVPSPGARGIDLKTGIRLSGGGGAVTADRQIKPDRYWNLKMVYSPVTTTAREVVAVAGQYVVPIQNRYSFTDLSELSCRWQALAGDQELSHGAIRIAAKPRSTVQAGFPVISGMNTLRLEFIHPDGRSVYAARLHVKGYQGPAAPAALTASGPIGLSETPEDVTVQSAGSQLVVDKRTGQIASWHYADQDVVVGGPILNIGESLPVPNIGGRNRGPSSVSSAQPPECRNPAVAARRDGANAKIEVACGVYLAGSDELKAQLNYTFDIGPNAQADISWTLNWKTADADAREAGLKFLLPAAAERMSWSSDSLFTEYPPDHIGLPQGAITSQDATFNSSRRDIHWVALSGGGNASLVALANGKPLHTHAIAAPNRVTVFLSSGIASTGRDVTGDDIRLTQATPVTGSFRLRLAAGSAK